MSVSAAAAAIFQARRADGRAFGGDFGDTLSQSGYINPITGIINGTGIDGGMLGDINGVLGMIPDVNIVDAASGALLDSALNEIKEFTGLYDSTTSVMILDMDRRLTLLSTYGAAASQLPGIIEACDLKSSKLFGPILQAGQDALAAIRAVIGEIRDAINKGIEFLQAGIAFLLEKLNQAKAFALGLLNDAKKALDDMLKDLFNFTDSLKLPGFFKDECFRAVLNAVLSPATLAVVAETVNPGSTTSV